jgi:hypothetical protein
MMTPREHRRWVLELCNPPGNPKMTISAYRRMLGLPNGQVNPDGSTPEQMIDRIVAHEFPQRVGITGDRSWNCPALARRIVRRLKARYGEDVIIVHGDCETGFDHEVELAAQEEGVRTERHPAKWDDLSHPDAKIRTRKDGKQYDAMAGPRRNGEMVASGLDFVIVGHPNLAGSKGTRDMVAQCLAVGLPVWLFDSEDGGPRRLTSVP